MYDIALFSKESKELYNTIDNTKEEEYRSIVEDLSLRRDDSQAQINVAIEKAALDNKLFEKEVKYYKISLDNEDTSDNASVWLIAVSAIITWVFIVNFIKYLIKRKVKVDAS